MIIIAAKAISEAFNKIGYEVVFMDVPALRAIYLLDTSGVDCYLFATEKFGKEHPSAVMVPSPLGYDEIMVFTKSVDVKVNGWRSLLPYSVGYMKGMDVVENNIKDMKIDGAENPIQIFNKLNAGRTDIAIMPRLVGYLFQAQYPEIKMLEPPLEKIALYAYLSAKRAALAPALANALTELQESGRLKAIIDQVLSELQKK